MEFRFGLSYASIRRTMTFHSVNIFTKMYLIVGTQWAAKMWLNGVILFPWCFDIFDLNTSSCDVAINSDYCFTKWTCCYTARVMGLKFVSFSFLFNINICIYVLCNNVCRRNLLYKWKLYYYKIYYINEN